MYLCHYSNVVILSSTGKLLLHLIQSVASFKTKDLKFKVCTRGTSGMKADVLGAPGLRLENLS